MDLKQATVTVPYEEFRKHQDEVKEIEWARDLKRRMDKGEMFEKSVVVDLQRKVEALGQYCYDRERKGTVDTVLPSDDRIGFFKKFGFNLQVNGPSMRSPGFFKLI